MSTSEASQLYGDEAADLRQRYRMLCSSLAQCAGGDAAKSDRLVTELEAIARRLTEIRLSQETATTADASVEAAAGATAIASTSPGQPAPPRTGNVIAYRVRLPGRQGDDPRLPTALGALVGEAVEMASTTVDEAPLPPQGSMVPPQSSPPSISPLPASLPHQAAELDRIAGVIESQSQQLQRVSQLLAQDARPNLPMNEVSELLAKLIAGGRRD